MKFNKYEMNLPRRVVREKENVCERWNDKANEEATRVRRVRIAPSYAAEIGCWPSSPSFRFSIFHPSFFHDRAMLSKLAHYSLDEREK